MPAAEPAGTVAQDAKSHKQEHGMQGNEGKGFINIPTVQCLSQYVCQGDTL